MFPTFYPNIRIKIEKYHKIVDRFIAEVEAALVHSLEELNRKWKIFLEMDYQKEAHNGIAEYYRSLDVSVPKGGISPQTEWMRDERMLKFMDVSVVAEAFLHHEEREIDSTGYFSFAGHKYEASAALGGCTVEISYDPMNIETITLFCFFCRVLGKTPLHHGENAALLGGL